MRRPAETRMLFTSLCTGTMRFVAPAWLCATLNAGRLLEEIEASGAVIADGYYAQLISGMYRMHLEQRPRAHVERDA
eukprot:6024749-Pleurochrysis_carterae.AAC.2